MIKIAIVGAASYVFGPSMIKQALVEHRLNDVELALMDPHREGVNLMGHFARRVASDLGLTARITTHTEADTALQGADFVICSAAREMARRFGMDCAIIDRHMPDHWATEFGGIAGTRSGRWPSSRILQTG